MKNPLHFNLQYTLYFLPLFLALLMTNKTLDRQLQIRLVILAAFMLVFSIRSVFRQKGSNILRVNKQNTILWFFIIAFIISLVVSLFITINPTDGIFQFIKWMLIFECTFFLYLITDDVTLFISRFTASIVLLSWAVCLMALWQILQIFMKNGFSHAGMYGATVTFGHKNLFAEYIVMLFPLTFYKSVVSSNKWMKIASISISLILLFLIVFLMTRSTWMALITGFVCTFFAGLLTGTLPVPNPKKFTFKSLGIMLILVLTIFIYVRKDPASAFSKQMTKITNFQHGGCTTNSI